MTIQGIEQSPKTKPKFFYGYIVVGAAAFILTVTYGMHFAFGVFFKPMIAELGWTRGITSVAFSIAKVVQGALGVGMGRLTDRFGPRAVMTVCSLLLCLGYLLMSQTHAVWQIYLFYGVIIGTGMSGTMVPLASTVARWFVDRRGMMTGIVLSGVSIGTLLGPPLASWLIATYDWRFSYIILGGIILVLVFTASQLLRRDSGQRSISYGRSKEETPRALKLDGKSFSLNEALRTGQFWVLFAAHFSFGVCVFTVLVHIVPHATDLGISAASAANILATTGVMSILGNVMLGSGADRLGNRQVYTICFILMSAALLWLVSATAEWMLYLFGAVFGLALGGHGASEPPLVAELFGLKSHGVIFGAMGVGITLGGAFGPSLTGYIYDVHGGYQIAFVVCTALAIIGLMLSLFIRSGKTTP